MTPSSRFPLPAVAVAALLVVSSPAHAQVPAATTANLKLIFDSTYFDTQRFGPARWIEDGTAYTTVERSAETKRGRDIVRYDTKTGARSILVPAASLIPPGDSLPLGIADYTWSADAKRLLIFTNTEKVWRQNTRGDYWVLDRTASTLQQVGGQAPKSSLMYAKFSPQGDRVAYVTQGRHLRRAARRPVGHPPHHRRRLAARERHERLGLRGGVQPARRLPLVARWREDRLLAFRHDRRRHLPHDEQHRLGLPFTVPIQYPLVGTTNSAVTRRRRLRPRRRHHLDPARRRRPAELSPLDGVGRVEGAAPAAHEPPAEHRRPAARRRLDRRGPHRLHREGRRLARRRRRRHLAQGRQATSSGSASATAGATSTACRGRRARRSW